MGQGYYSKKGKRVERVAGERERELKAERPLNTPRIRKAKREQEAVPLER